MRNVTYVVAALLVVLVIVLISSVTYLNQVGAAARTERRVIACAAANIAVDGLSPASESAETPSESGDEAEPADTQPPRASAPSQRGDDEPSAQPPKSPAPTTPPGPVVVPSAKSKASDGLSSEDDHDVISVDGNVRRKRLTMNRLDLGTDSEIIRTLPFRGVREGVVSEAEIKAHLQDGLYSERPSTHDQDAYLVRGRVVMERTDKGIPDVVVGQSKASTRRGVTNSSGEFEIAVDADSRRKLARHEPLEFWVAADWLTPAQPADDKLPEKVAVKANSDGLIVIEMTKAKGASVEFTATGAAGDPKVRFWLELTADPQGWLYDDEIFMFCEAPANSVIRMRLPRAAGEIRAGVIGEEFMVRQAFTGGLLPGARGVLKVGFVLESAHNARVTGKLWFDAANEVAIPCACARISAVTPVAVGYSGLVGTFSIFVPVGMEGALESLTVSKQLLNFSQQVVLPSISSGEAKCDIGTIKLADFKPFVVLERGGETVWQGVGDGVAETTWRELKASGESRLPPAGPAWASIRHPAPLGELKFLQISGGAVNETIEVMVGAWAYPSFGRRDGAVYVVITLSR
ncbi:MAG: hypothetical protein IT462_03840 [Planctomycetes bacterium]|nr:hypothetical protein [Planctomycetota bacterium]